MCLCVCTNSILFFFQFNNIFTRSDPVWPLRSCNMKSIQ